MNISGRFKNSRPVAKAIGWVIAGSLVAFTLFGAAPRNEGHRLTIVGFAAGHESVRFTREFAATGRIAVHQGVLNGYVDVLARNPVDCHIELTLAGAKGSHGDDVHVYAWEKMDLGTHVTYPRADATERILVKFE